MATKRSSTDSPSKRKNSPPKTSPTAPTKKKPSSDLIKLKDLGTPYVHRFLTFPIPPEDDLKRLIQATTHTLPNGEVVQSAVIDNEEKMVGVPRYLFRGRTTKYAGQETPLNRTDDGAGLRGVTPSFQLWSDIQRGAVESVVSAYDQGEYGGILELGCGRGKTVIALALAVELQLTTLVVVTNTTHMEQWIKQIDEKLGLRAGVIQGDTFDVEEITVAMLQTLISRPAEKIAPALRFGLTIFDEVHHMAAPSFNKAMSLNGSRFRLGLTATIRRSDGLEGMFINHLGRVLYSHIETDTKPQVIFRRSPFVLPLEAYARVKTGGLVNMTAVRKELADDLGRNLFIASLVEDCLREDRRVLILVHLVHHAVLLHDMLAQSKVTTIRTALLVGHVPVRERVASLQHADVCVGTMQAASEGMDWPQLDTLILASPFASEALLTQSFGRVSRQYAGKKYPKVVVVEDGVPFVQGTLKRIKQYCRTNEIPMETPDGQSEDTA